MPQLFPLVESCLPEDILRIWRRSHSNSDSFASSYKSVIKQTYDFFEEVEG